MPWKVTVDILLDTKSHADTAHAVSKFLTEQGTYVADTHILDWQYRKDGWPKLSDGEEFPEYREMKLNEIRGPTPKK
jgi:hypothetical protein